MTLPDPTLPVNPTTTNNPVVDNSTDISHLNLGYATLGELRNAEQAARTAARSGPAAPESYKIDNLVKTFGEVVNPDDPAHQAEVAFCRQAGMTQNQMEQHLGRFYQSGKEQFEQFQEFKQGRDNALIEKFGGEENANTALNRVYEMGIDTRNLSAEDIIKHHGVWEKNYSSGVNGGLAGDQTAPDGKARENYQEENVVNWQGVKYGFDPADINSVNAFSNIMVKSGNRELPLSRAIPRVQAMVERGLKENAKIQAGRAEARKQALDNFISNELIR